LGNQGRGGRHQDHGSIGVAANSKDQIIVNELNILVEGAEGEDVTFRERGGSKKGITAWSKA